MRVDVGAAEAAAPQHILSILNFTNSPPLLLNLTPPLPPAAGGGGGEGRDREGDGGRGGMEGFDYTQKSG